MIPRILLVNPPIYDFSAYDFWMKPYGLLSVGGALREKASLELFDFLDRKHPSNLQRNSRASDQWGRGRFISQDIEKPACFRGFRRRYRRYGLPREVFTEFARSCFPFDFVLIGSMMTYWYPGVREVIEDVRSLWPGAKIILGGVYATLCHDHACRSGADIVVGGAELKKLWEFLGISPDEGEIPFWESYSDLETGVLKLTDSCPFDCSYCAVRRLSGAFRARPVAKVLRELWSLSEMGVKNIAFYDDALLYQPENVLIPFLDEVIDSRIKVNFHTPNALNARFLAPSLARKMVDAGFRTFYIGFESGNSQWQNGTGGKVSPLELETAVRSLFAAGASPEYVTAYILAGHPRGNEQDVEGAMRFANFLGIRVMLAEYSPIPGTPDGEACRKWADLDEPLWQNKTAFSGTLLGERELNRLKRRARELNEGTRKTHEVF